MRYLDKLKAHLSEKDPGRIPPKPPKPGLGGLGGYPSGLISASEQLSACRKGLLPLDHAEPLHGLPGARWRQLLDDAGWLLEGFAPAAFSHGWTIGEMFGQWVWDDNATITLKDAWGGIADRLQGSRSLKMTADRATWRCFITGEPDVFLRTAYPNLKPLWEGGR